MSALSLDSNKLYCHKINSQPIPVVDVFAGPGGLGEGFSSILNLFDTGTRRFNISLSIEKDPFAHQTLLLRTFLRQFPVDKLPKEYYAFLEGNIKTLECLFELYPNQIEAARQQAWKAVLVKDKDGIKGVSDTEVDNRIRMAVKGASDWILIGGPPCQAYSIVGRARNKGVIDPDDPRVYLYREYYRILAVHQPSIFVMENVKGLLSSKVKDDHIFTQIISDLENPANAYSTLHGTPLYNASHPGYYLYSLVNFPVSTDLFGKPGYKQRDFLIKSEKYGVPQKRHRLILMGIRKDLAPHMRVKLIRACSEEVISVRNVIDGLPAVRSQLSEKNGGIRDSDENWLAAIQEGFHSDEVWQGTDEKTFALIKETVNSLHIPKYNIGNRYIDFQASPAYNPNGWYTDGQQRGVCNHETRAHIRLDLLRYLFAACYTQVHKRFPRMLDYPKGLLPAHKNVEEAVNKGKFSDRFCVQAWDEPSRTITSHISKDGHYYIHPDPNQCRSMTVREAARIQTFPDNYYFCGPRTAQFHQVGNAVPPYLAHQIADVVSDLFSQIEYSRQQEAERTAKKLQSV